MSFTLKHIPEDQLSKTDPAAPKKLLKERLQPLTSPIGGFFEKNRRKKLIALTLVSVLVLSGIWFLLGRTNSAAAAEDATYTTVPVERRNLSAEVTGSGTLEAANAYSVTSLAEGAILTANFEEGDQVEQGQILYTIDASDVASSLEQAQISLNQAQRNYNNKVENRDTLTGTSTISGRVVSLEVEAGDDVSAGQAIATIRNSDVMSLTVPFPADDAADFYLGQSATVTLDSTFETLTGTVTKVSSVETVSTGNMILRDVTVKVSNPGGLSVTQNGTVEIAGIGSSAGGSFSYLDEATVTAKASGEVAALYVSEGDWVNKNQRLLALSSDTLEDDIQSASESLRNAQLSLENRSKQLDDYTITSPISGTIVDKNYKAGETSEANQVLCTIYDLSYLTMTLNVDELDISSIAVGQTVSLIADAVEGKTYDGIVTKVSVAGTASNGVTTYPVTIRIDGTEGLLPGMTADATIVLDSAEQVLAIPAAALLRDNQVMVTADSPSAKNAENGDFTLGGMAGQRPDANSSPNSDRGASAQSQAAKGYIALRVTTGVSDDTYIEITSGLQEGDTVAYIKTNTTGSGFGTMNGMGGMPGGDVPGSRMSGGGMPGGGAGGPRNGAGGF
jgi:HlyD family secretion protein